MKYFNGSVYYRQVCFAKLFGVNPKAIFVKIRNVKDANQYCLLKVKEKKCKIY